MARHCDRAGNQRPECAWGDGSLERRQCRSHRITRIRFSVHYHQALSHFERIVDLYPVFRVV
jgi:hypothetical protein